MTGGWPANMREAFPLTRTSEQALTHQLSLCGISPSQVDTVVLSHLHLDHAGGAHFFPRAKIYVQQEELKHVMADQKNGTLSVFHQKCDLDNWEQAHLQWYPFPPVCGKFPSAPVLPL